MFFDSHSHLNLAAFDKDREVVLKRTLTQGFFVINVGTCWETSQKAVEIAQDQNNCWASVGIHPSHTIPLAKDKEEISLINSSEVVLPAEVFDQKWEELLRQPKVVAIGECGLDYSYLKSFSLDQQERYKKQQREVFSQQIKAAQTFHFPLILHIRNVYEEALEMLEQFPLASRPGVFHFFLGSWNQAEIILRKGFYLGFSGVITYSSQMDNVIEKVPLERILIETDAPYAAPIPHRGQRNEPIFVKEVARKIAQIKKLPLQKVEEATFQNTLHLFGIKQ